MSEQMLLDEEVCISIPKTLEAITPERSKLLRYTYRDGALKRNSEIIGKRDSTSIWFSKEMLQELIAACDGKHLAASGDAVQLHWAAYPVDYFDTDLAGRQTIVIEVGDNSVYMGPILCPPWCPGSPCPKPTEHPEWPPYEV
jgi:hypothetical protein